MMSLLYNIDWTPFLISFKLALISTAILFIFITPIAYFMSRVSFRGQSVVEAIFSLPLVLPPTVLGFYILVFFSPYSAFGGFLEHNFGVRLVFNFYGLVFASCIYSLPFVFAPMFAGFKQMPKSLIEASYSLGKGRIRTLFSVVLPCMKPSILSSAVISFAHTLGEFGVVLMIGGSLNGSTKVASIAIFEAVELLNYDLAHIYSGVMLFISFAVLLAVFALNRWLA